MATITCLSDEVISIILGNVNISIKDVMSFASTCTQFRNAVNDDNILWQNKLYQRWPNLKKVYNKRKCEEHVNFEKEVKASIKCRKELWCYVMQMSEIHYYKDDLSDSDMKDFDTLFRPDKGAHSMNYYFLIDEIMSYLESSKNTNLTHRYYIKKVLRYLRQCHLKSMWQKFINYSDKQQLLEQAATIVAQWYQPRKHVPYSHVKASLANITQQTLECLKKEYPKHPIFSTSAELFSFWEHNNIDDNQWDSIEGKQIIDTLRKVLFHQIGFSGTWLFMNPGVTNPKHTLIDHVLERKIGNTVSLAIIFQSVARRLGIRCDLISFPSHFFLSWKSKYNTTNFRNEECFYIDVLNYGSILSRNDCPRIRGANRCPIENFNEYNKITPTEVMLRMINYLQIVNRDKKIETRSLLELQHLIEPDDIDTIAQLGHYYIQHHMDLSNLIVKLTEIQNNYKNIRCAEVRRAEMVLDKFKKYTERLLPCNETIRQKKKQRPKEMMFRIGMIVTCHDKVTSHSLKGVIIGWDEEFNSRVEMEWKQCRPLYNRPFPGSNTLSQPFYKVLCEDGKAYYVVEDAIKKKRSSWMKHKEIGRYFCKFERDSFVPNEMLAEHYPCDLQ